MAKQVKHWQSVLSLFKPFFFVLGLDNLKVTLFDLFLAGSETTSTTLNWAVLYMVRYPEIQAQVQEELDTVVGTDR